MAQTLSVQEMARFPYPPDVLPGGRDVESPYGSIQVFEWGPETGERVLLMHGIGTPCLALGDMAHEFVSQGYRVMLFDLFGRGYSYAPVDVPYDMRLYTVQILLVLASSPIAWTGDNGFHLVGYSLGGGIAAAFASYFPRMIRSATFVAGGGLLRSQHISFRSRVLYSTGILPERILEWLVKGRLMPKDTAPEAAVVAEEVVEPGELAGAGTEGPAGFDDVRLSQTRPGGTVSSVIRWQLCHHRGFVKAYMSSIRHAPIYEQYEDWHRLASVLAERRDSRSPEAGMMGGKVLLILGSSDSVVLKDEVVPDTRAVLGDEAVSVVVLDCGHEIAIARGVHVAHAAIGFWKAAADSDGP